MYQKFCRYCGQPVLPRDFDVLVCVNNHENWLNAAPCAKVYIMHGDKVLFGKRSIEPGSGLLDAPGGYLKLNETAEEGALRETQEEVGLDVVLHDYLGSYNSETSDHRRALTAVFVADYTGGEAVPGDDMSGGGIVWRAIDDLPSRDELAWAWQERAQADLQAWYHARHKNK